MILTLDLLAALATLSELERQVVIDHHVLGDSPAEIADRLGCSSKWVYVVERRAMRKLRARLRAQRLYLPELVAA